MIRIYTKQKNFIEVVSHENATEILRDTIWIDLLAPSESEINLVESELKIILPSKKEMYGIEISNRIYQEDNNFFLTVSLLVNSETPTPEVQPATFVVVGDRLITIRYCDPHPFKTFISRKEKIISASLDGKDILISLLENISERVADILEKYGHLIDELSVKTFKPVRNTKTGRRNTNYERVLKDIGLSGDMISKARESLISISRVVSYIRQTPKFRQEADEVARIEILDVDVRALSDHASFISNKINFLLEATLGMINIQQNGIIKIFTVATMVFLPPTLIASIYGMNFKAMPELDWRFGYGFAIMLMVLSAYLPYKYFKKKGWL